MSTSQFALDYTEYEALLADRFDMALTVVGQPLMLRLPSTDHAPQPEPQAPRPALANPQQRQSALVQSLTMRSWANALLADAHQLLSARTESGEQPGQGWAEAGWRVR